MNQKTNWIVDAVVEDSDGDIKTFLTSKSFNYPFCQYNHLGINLQKSQN